MKAIISIVSQEYDLILTRFQMNSYVTSSNSKTESRSLNKISQKALTPELAELLYDLDDETYRKIFKILPPITPLTEGDVQRDVQHDRGGVVVAVPLPMEDGLGHDEKKTGVEKLPKSTADNGQCDGARRLA